MYNHCIQCREKLVQTRGEPPHFFCENERCSRYGVLTALGVELKNHQASPPSTEGDEEEGEQMKEPCLIHKTRESDAVRWVLHSAIEDARDWKKNLTDEEIEYCLSKESRITVRKMLEVEKRKRLRARA